MNMIIDFLKGLGVIGVIFDAVILCFAVWILGGLRKTCKDLKETRKTVEKAHNNTAGYYTRNSRGDLQREDTVVIERQDYEKTRKKFNEEFVEYNAFSNLISLLPMLGLLGTVVGLMPGLGAVRDGDFDLLYSSLATSLTSTFLGLIAAIGLKFYVSHEIGKIVDKIEIDLAEIDRLYQML